MKANKEYTMELGRNLILRTNDKLVLLETLPDEWEYYFPPFGADIAISIEKLEDLHEVRMGLRKRFGSWADLLAGIWVPYSNTVCIEWTGKREDFTISIRFNTTIEEFPKLGIAKDGEDCDFIKKTDESYHYVCNKK